MRRVAMPEASSARANVELAVFDLDRLADREEDLLATLSPPERRVRRGPGDRTTLSRWGLRRGALRWVLAEAVGTDPAALVFASGPWGKPRLVGAGGPAFSASSSGAWAAVALSHDVDLGLDLEQVRHVPEWASIARTHFGPAIASRLAALPPGEADRAFLRWWTRHEAGSKRRGVGLSQDQVLPGPLPPQEGERSLHFDVEGQALLCVAVPEPSAVAPLRRPPHGLARALLRFEADSVAAP